MDLHKQPLIFKPILKDIKIVFFQLWFSGVRENTCRFSLRPFPQGRSKIYEKLLNMTMDDMDFWL